MSIERTYRCDNSSCTDDKPGDSDARCHARTATPPPRLPAGFIETRQRFDGDETRLHFCSWDCVMKYAATQPAPEVIPWEEALGAGDA